MKITRIVRFAPDEGASSATPPPVPAADQSARIAQLEARIQQMDAEKQRAADKAREKAEKAAADALAAAEKKAADAEKTLADERTARAVADRNRAIWTALTDGKLTDADGDAGKALKIRTDVVGEADLASLYKLDDVKLTADGKLPAGFVNTVREWVKAHPGRFQVGDGDAAAAGQQAATDGGAVGRSGAAPAGPAGEDAALRARAHADFDALFPRLAAETAGTQQQTQH